MKISILIFLLVTCTGPLWKALFSHIDYHADYRTASRATTHLAPRPEDDSEAIVQVYAARAFNWRGIFALHMWVAAKPRFAKIYSIYQVIGWRKLRGLPPLSITQDIPDRLWYNHKPYILLDIRGAQAESIITQINEVALRYPYSNEYLTWPGPNSNTFVAYLARNIPDMKLALPSIAVGKDFTGSHFLTKAPSNTGYQLSLYGYLGILLAYKEGLEVNLLGLVYGINPFTLTIKLPGWGDISLK